MLFPLFFPCLKTLLSAMLHRENNEYDEDAVEWWKKLRTVFGTYVWIMDLYVDVWIMGICMDVCVCFQLNKHATSVMSGLNT